MRANASLIIGGTMAGLFAVGLSFLIGQAKPIEHYDYWDAHGCINHLDGSLYEGTADKLSEFPREDTCKEYVHHIN